MKISIKNRFGFIIKTTLFILLTLPMLCNAQTTTDEVINDMVLAHEGLPHGVPLSYDWAQKPRKGAPEPGVGWTAAIAWGQVYEWANGSAATNIRIQIKDLEMYYLSKTDHKWHLLQKSLKVSGANYVEDFVDDINKPADIRTESDGTISTTCGSGYNFHFWPNSGRVTIPVNDVAGCFATVKARIIMDDKNGIDDRLRAKYLMSVGGDWWLSLTAPWDNFKTNWDIGISRFRFITPEWKSFSMYSVLADTLRKNPPPFQNSTASVNFISDLNSSFDIYPVPTNSVCSIKFSISKPTTVKISAIDINGRVVENISIANWGVGEHVINWNTDNLPPGIYFVIMENGETKTMMKKVIRS